MRVADTQSALAVLVRGPIGVAALPFYLRASPENRGNIPCRRRA